MENPFALRLAQLVEDLETLWLAGQKIVINDHTPLIFIHFTQSLVHITPVGVKTASELQVRSTHTVHCVVKSVCCAIHKWINMWSVSWMDLELLDWDFYLLQAPHKVVADWRSRQVSCARASSHVEEIIRAQHSVVLLGVTRGGQNPIHWYCHLTMGSKWLDLITWSAWIVRTGSRLQCNKRCWISQDWTSKLDLTGLDWQGVFMMPRMIRQER